MRQKVVTLLSLIGGCLAFVTMSCSKDTIVSEEVVYIKTLADADESMYLYYNDMIEKYAKTLAAAMPNAELRSAIKSQAMLRFDGDYDVLASTLHAIAFINGTTCGSFLADIYDILFSEEEMNGEKFISTIVEVMPNLQVSVPVYCDEWDLNYIPQVV